MLKGIDTNIIYQGNELTAAMVKAEGADFHIAALTQGAYWDRPGTIKRIRENQDAGLIAGAYHFLTRIVEPGTDKEVAWNSGAAQCRFFIEHLPRQGGRRSPAGLLIALDVENAPASEVVHDGVAFRQDANGPSWRIVRDFVKEWFATFPLHPLFIYSSWGEWFRGSRDVQALDPNVHCWNADWVKSGHGRRLGRAWDDAAFAEFEQHAALADPFKPRWGGFAGARLWQCAGFGIKGIGKVDGNLFKGTRAELLSYTTDRQVDGPSPHPVPTDDPVRLEVSPVGRVSTLQGVGLEATLRLAPGSSHVARYRIQLGPHGARAAAFQSGRLWEARGGPLFPQRADLDDDDPVDVDDEPDDADDEPPTSDARALTFDTLDGRPARQWIAVRHRSPVARLRSSRPIKSYTWQLYQHAELVERSRNAETAGIDPDGLGITITPAKELCPSEAPPEGYFFPPIKRRNTSYHGVTYSRTTEHDDHSAFSVDFNWRSGGADLGHAVLAAAPGIFVRHDTQFGSVYIDHWGGALRTEYSHMDNTSIRRALAAIRKSPRNAERKGKPPLIGLLDVVGTISDQGTPGAIHLHHRHYKRVVRGGVETWVPTKMRFRRRPVPASLSAAKVAAKAPGWVSSPRFLLNGWSARAGAKLVVTVRFADGGPVRKETRALRFTVGAQKAHVAKRQRPAKTHSRAGRKRDVVLEHVYDGGAIPNGKYSLRYRCVDDQGQRTPWTYDDSLVVG